VTVLFEIQTLVLGRFLLVIDFNQLFPG